MGLGGAVEGEPLSTLLRHHLAARLAREVDRRGIVVWVDPYREYDGVAEAICPPQAQFLRWQGSWYRLRRALDEQVGGVEPPRLVIYQPVATPPEQEDPLAEVRLGGAEFQYRLGTLIRDALAGRLSPQRVEQLTRTQTLEEAEAALAAGVAAGVRLPAVLGTGEPREMVLRLLADPDVETRLGERGLWEEAREVLRHLMGARLDGEGPALRRAIFRHLVLVELAEAGWEPPFGVAAQVDDLTPQQRQFCRDVLGTWRSDARRRAAYLQLATELEQELRPGGLLSWNDAFADLDTLPALDRLAFDAAVTRLREGRLQEALELARRRQWSIWVVGEAPGAVDRQAAWKAAEGVAQLLNALEGHPVPPAGNVDEFLAWYVESGWRVDRAHRLMEASLTHMSRLGDLEEPVSRARGAYEAWLEQVLARFVERVAAAPWQPRLPAQWEVHSSYLMPVEEPTAYVLVDALRFELGLALAEALEGVVADPPVEVVPVVATPPTVTAVGMASLLPGAERGLKLGIAGDRLEVAVGGNPVRDVADRVALLRAGHGEVVDLPLEEVLRWSEAQLRERIGGARLVLVRVQEIDELLEGRPVLTLLRHLSVLTDHLVKAIGRLTAAGVGRFLITGDHGFLLLSRPLGISRVVEPPGGEGVLLGRCWVGRGGVTAPAALRLPLSHFGLAGDLDIVVPKGLGAFRASEYFHGGLSPQELVVPVIRLRTQPPAATTARLEIEVIGGRIATGIFNAALRLEPDLFSGVVQVYVEARSKGGKQVALSIAGQGYHEGSGTVELSPQAAERIVTFRVVAPLRKGTRVVLEAYDLSGRRLGRAEVPVVADVEVEA